MRRNEQVIGPYGRAGPLQLRTDIAIVEVHIRAQRQHRQDSQDGLKLCRESGRTPFCRAVSKFAGHDDARAYDAFAHPRNAPRYRAMRIVHQV